MKAIAGPLAGHQLRMHQYANNWVTVDLVECPFDNDGDGNCKKCARINSVVINPLHLELDDAEEAAEWKTHVSTGMFWSDYELGEDRRFHRKVRYNPKEHH